MRVRKLATIAAAGILVAVPIGVLAAPATATTMNCMYTGPVVGHPGMQYIYLASNDRISALLDA
ncbi:hypothetical protein BOX37_12490 [Nocardia mangyaensis]|uniref:Uncharacterized protein n=1 Tax=Nocardia mangyaensis TaxID=2213200 RepID=A0A1J0VRJ9_9NOCA|nr:hypothetical protein BOX37_12490 [Nocardia mangyaensis]